MTCDVKYSLSFTCPGPEHWPLSQVLQCADRFNPITGSLHPIPLEDHLNMLKALMPKDLMPKLKLKRHFKMLLVTVSLNLCY